MVYIASEGCNVVSFLDSKRGPIIIKTSTVGPFCNSNIILCQFSCTGSGGSSGTVAVVAVATARHVAGAVAVVFC